MYEQLARKQNTYYSRLQHKCKSRARKHTSSLVAEVLFLKWAQAFKVQKTARVKLTCYFPIGYWWPHVLCHWLLWNPCKFFEFVIGISVENYLQEILNDEQKCALSGANTVSFQVSSQVWCELEFRKMQAGRSETNAGAVRYSTGTDKDKSRASCVLVINDLTLHLNFF